MSRDWNDATRPQRLDRPPSDGPPRFSVVRLKGSERISGFILNPHFWGFQIHWNATRGRSQKCTGNKDQCDGCKAQLPIKSVWYLHLLTPERGQIFIELPPSAANRLLEQLAEGESLRGLRVVISRSRADNGRLRIEVDQYASRREELPCPVDPERTLSALWNWGAAC